MHRDIPVEQKEYEYLFVVSKEMDKGDLIEKGLQSAQFYTQVYATLDPQYKYIVVTLPEKEYRDVATEWKLIVGAKKNHVLVQYDKLIKNSFVPFSQSQRHLMLKHVIDKS